MNKLFKEQFLIPLFIIIITVFSLSAFFIRVFSTPPDRVFLGTQFYSDDFSVYNSVIEQGIKGNLFFTNKYSTEPTPSSPLRFQYILLGKAGGILNLSAPQIYHLSRVILGLIFLLTTYCFIKEILPGRKHRIIAFFLALFSIGLPVITDKGTIPRLLALPELDILLRFFAQPHYQMASISTLIIFILFLKYLKAPRIGYVLVSCLLGIFSSIADPSAMIIASCSLTIFYLAFFFLNNPSSFHDAILQLKKGFFFLFPFLVVILLVGVFLKSFETQEPWKTIFAWDKTNQFPITLSEYLLAIGTTVFLAPFAFISLLFHRKSFKSITLLPLFWIIITFLLVFFLSPILGINRVRFLHTPIFIPFAILAAYGLVWLSKCIPLIWEAAKSSPQKNSRSLSASFIFISLLVILFISLPACLASFNYQIREFPPSSTLIYPTREQFEGMMYLRNNTNKEDVVLALYEAGSVIPFISGNTVYAGNVTETLNYSNKTKQTTDFFQGVLSIPNARAFLNENHINYLFVGFQENQWQTDFSQYTFIKKLYENQSVKIFKNTLL